MSKAKASTLPMRFVSTKEIEVGIFFNGDMFKTQPANPAIIPSSLGGARLCNI
jgi:hypothetical protein